MPGIKLDPKEPVTMAKRFMTFCLAVLVGIVLLYLALQLLSLFWGWLVLLAVIGVGVFIGIRLAVHRRNRW